MACATLLLSTKPAASRIDNSTATATKYRGEGRICFFIILSDYPDLSTSDLTPLLADADADAMPAERHVMKKAVPSIISGFSGIGSSHIDDIDERASRLESTGERR